MLPSSSALLVYPRLKPSFPIWFFSLLCSLLFDVIVVQGSLTCDAAWTLSDGSCFRYYSSGATFANAETNCANARFGAHLATITSATQNTAAANLAS
ncbi:hypothetical protein CYMTET_12537, partial [Cymbomonas tetramitiformis]